MEVPSILKLTDDCLINILKFCDIQSLGRVSSTCKRLNTIIEKYESIWMKKSQKVLGSNLNSPIMVQKSMPILTPLQRCKVSFNFVGGLNDETAIMRYSTCLPWICLERDHLFVSKGNKIVKLPRNNNGDIGGGRWTAGFTLHNDDISRFVINGEEIFSVGWDGNLCQYHKTDMACVRIQYAHKKEILGLDSRKHLVITGSRDETIKVWKIGPNHKPLDQVSELNAEIRVLSLSLLPSMKFLIAGLPGTKGKHPLPMFDIENEKKVLNIGDNHKYGGGFCDIYPESDNIILTCGYDATVKLYDLRTPKKCVSQWNEPYDNILYSVKSDHNITIVAGANRSGYFHLYDKRSTRVIQTYSCCQFPSPVYSLEYDASHVFIALSRAVVQYCFMFN